MRFTKLFAWCQPQKIRSSHRAGSDSQVLRRVSGNRGTAGLRSTDLTLAAVLPVGADISRRQYIRLVEQVFGEMSEE